MRARARREGVPLYVRYVCDLCVHVWVSCARVCGAKVYLYTCDICVICVCMCACNACACAARGCIFVYEIFV